jgi:hypothetical protein
MWYLGLISAQEIFAYQKKIPGIFYKQGWKYLSYGIVWLVAMSIAFQYLTTLTARLTDWSIYKLLTLVFALLLALSIGFVLMAYGTDKLQKIEEV